ncbi:MAG: hypothetical protein DWQ05_16210 [Calditrichaeota bacterium]|nr:MAG: hypothetical protein DWQ05_16210 [Calditrichota bacterium]
MKIVFSEYKSDYQNYIFPYAVWAFPEDNETPASLFAHGFLPATRDMDRYYMCRQIRVRLNAFSASSENRRILRKGENINARLIPIANFDYTPERRNSYKTYADIKFGKDIMTYKRLDSLFNSKIITHLLVFSDTEQDKEIGTATLFIESNELVYYYYAFYDLNYYARNLGMYMMTAATKYFAEQNSTFLYLGTCYTKNALYKIQFKGSEFFTGFSWSSDLRELKFLIKREQQNINKHLLETPEYCEKFYNNEIKQFAHKSSFKIRP